MAVTRTAKGTASNKTSGTTLALASVASTAGRLLVVCLAYDDQTLSSVTWGTQVMNLQTAVLGAGVRTRLAWCVAEATATRTITATWAASLVAKAFVVSEFSSSLAGGVVNAGQETNNTGTGTAASTPASNPIVGGTDSVLVGVVGTEGPSGDTAGTWVTPATNGQRVGTTGNPANGNVTVSEAYTIAPTAGSTPALSKTGMTSRDWGAELQGFYWAVPQAYNRSASDTTAVTESVARAKGIRRTATDSITAVTTSVSGTVTPGTGETVIFSDTFSRTSSPGWGTSDSGHVWDDTDDPADFTVGSGVGQVAIPNTSSPHNNTVAEGTINVVDAIGRVKWRLSQRPSSGFVTMIRFYTRRGLDLGDTGDADAEDIRHAIRIRDNGSIELQHDYSINAVRTEVNATWFVTGKTYVAGDQWNCRYEVSGSAPSITVRTRVWKVGDAEPSTWDLSETFNPGSADINHGGTTGIHLQTSVGNTAVPFNLQLDDWTLSQPGGGGTAVTRTASDTTSVSDSVNATKNGGGGLITYAQDTFGGTNATGWNTADIGGSWTMVGTALSEGSGVGTMNPAAGATQRGNLLSVSAQDTDSKVRVRFSDAINTASGINAYVESRFIDSANHYRVRCQFTSTNQVRLQIEMNGTAVTNGAFITVARETFAANTWFWIRVQTEGVNPTTIRAKVWQDGTTEPVSWDLVGTDSTAALQGAGSPGLRAFTGSTQSPAGQYDWDDLSVTSISTGGVAYTRTAADTVTSSESLARLTAFGRTTSETLTTAETVARAYSTTRTATDTTAASDSVARATAATRTAGLALGSPLTIALADTFSRTGGSWGNGWTGGDATNGSVGTLNALAWRSDVPLVHEVLAKFRKTVGTGNDSIRFKSYSNGTSATGSGLVLNIPASGTIGAGAMVGSTAATFTTGVVAALNQWYWVRVQIRDYREQVAFKLWLDGDPEPGTWSVRTFTSNTSASPGGSVAVELGIVTNPTFEVDEITYWALDGGPTESALRTVGMLRTAVDTTTLSESIFAAVVHSVFRTATDTVALTEQAARTLALARAPPDTVTVTESIARVKGAQRTASDTVAFSQVRVPVLIDTFSRTLPTGTLGTSDSGFNWDAQSSSGKADVTVAGDMSLGGGSTNASLTIRVLAHDSGMFDWLPVPKTGGSAIEPFVEYDTVFGPAMRLDYVTSNGNVVVTLGDGGTTLTFTPLTWLRCRWEFAYNQGELDRIKIWPRDQAEPGTWSFTSPAGSGRNRSFSPYMYLCNSRLDSLTLSLAQQVSAADVAGRTTVQGRSALDAASRESMVPDGVVSSAQFAGATLSQGQALDNVYLTATGTSAAIRLSFPTPTSAKAAVRLDALIRAGSTDTTATVEYHENGALVLSSGSVVVPANTRQWVSVTVPAASVVDETGAEARLSLNVIGAGIDVVLWSRSGSETVAKTQGGLRTATDTTTVTEAMARAVGARRAIYEGYADSFSRTTLAPLLPDPTFPPTFAELDGTQLIGHPESPGGSHSVSGFIYPNPDIGSPYEIGFDFYVPDEAWPEGAQGYYEVDVRDGWIALLWPGSTAGDWFMWVRDVPGDGIAFTPELNAMHRVRFRVPLAAGDPVLGKVWPLTQPEPATWTDVGPKAIGAGGPDATDSSFYVSSFGFSDAKLDNFYAGPWLPDADAANRSLGISRTATDTTTVTEAIASVYTPGTQNLTRTATDTTTLTEQLGRTLNAARAPPETLTTSASVARVQGRARTVIDTVATTASVARAGSRLRTAVDTTSVNESVAPRFGRARTTADTVATTESVAAPKVLFRTANDTTAVTDLLNQGQIRRAADTVVTTDAVNRSGVFSRTASDTAAVTEAVARAVVAARTATDATALSESVARAAGQPRIVADTTAVGEAVARAIIATRSAADTTVTSDSVARTTVSSRTVADATAVSELVARSGTFARTATDTTTVSDALNQGQIRRAVDAVVTTDAVARSGVFARTATDTTTVAETTARIVGVKRTTADTTTVTESVAVAPRAIFRSAADTTSVNDSVAATGAHARAAADTTVTSESIAASTAQTRSASDAVSTADSVAARLASARTATDAVAATESAAHHIGATRSVNEVTSLSESVGATSTHARSATDTTVTSDSVTSQATARRTAAETLVTADALTSLQVLTRAISDDVPIGTDYIDTGAGAVLRIATDTVTTDEQVDREVVSARAADDTLATDDALAAASAHPRAAEDDLVTADAVASRADVSRAVADAVATSEAATASTAQARAAADTTATTESIAEHRAFYRAASESLTTTDAVSTATSNGSGLSDTVVTSDSVATHKALFRAAADIVVTSDTAQDRVGASRQAADAVATDDTIASRRTVHVTASDATATSDAITVAAARTRRSTDTLATGDSVARYAPKTRTADDATATSDTVTSGVGNRRTAMDATSTTDSVARSAALGRAATDTRPTSDAVSRIFGTRRTAEDTLATDDVLVWFTNTFVPSRRATVRLHNVGRNNATVHDAALAEVGIASTGNDDGTRASSATGVVVRVRTRGTNGVTVSDD